MNLRTLVIASTLFVSLFVTGARAPIVLANNTAAADVDLEPTHWQDDYRRYMDAQAIDREQASVASGKNGAVTVAYNGLAARAGLEALKQGGNAIDALLTAALTQVALTAGAPISYFGILSLVYYDAESGQVHTMNAEWNTLLEEDSPSTIPGGIDMTSPDGILGTEVSGRTALVGGFMKGVGEAHARFGRLPFAQLFEPAIYVAEQGMPISEKMAGYWQSRAADLARLPETKKTLLKENGEPYVAGDLFRQQALAKTLRAVAERGTDYMYEGPWAKKLVQAIQDEGGKMTLEDLAGYEVIWSKPLVADMPNGYRIYTNPQPNNGGVALIEAQRLAVASGMIADGHFTESGKALEKALDITQLYALDFLPAAMREQMYPGVGFSPEERVTPENAAKLWAHVVAGKRLMKWQPPTDPGPPKHSDDVVAIDRWGNIAAITQSINCVLWGKTAIVVDGVTIGDPASFQQAQIARVGRGQRLESPTETGILFKDGKPVLGFASMGSGLHHRTFQALVNVIHYGMTVDQAINTPDFFMPRTDVSTLQVTPVFPQGRFPKDVLDGMGHAYEEIDPKNARFGGEGLWVAIQRDPETGELRAAAHNRNNSAATAY